MGAVIRVYFKSRFLFKVIMETRYVTLYSYIRSYIALSCIRNYSCIHSYMYRRGRIELYSYIRSFIAVYVAT